MTYMDDALARREGWGNAVTGGKDYPLVTVKTLADSGTGSLRTAMKASARIQFDESLRGNVVLKSPLELKSNTTIDAGSRVNIVTENHFDSMHVQGIKNWILLRLKFDDAWDGWQSDTEGADALRLCQTDGFWIDHCTFERQKDGLIDCRADGQTSGTAVTPDVTNGSVTWCKFARDYQALNWTADRITLAHSWLKDCYARGPQIVGGRCHAYGNVVENWKKDTIEHAKEGGQLLSEYSMYNGNGFIGKVTAGGKLQRIKPYIIGGKPAFVSSGTVSSSFAADSRARAKIVKPSDVAAWKAEVARVQRYAGAV